MNASPTTANPELHLLRHTLATLAYRGGKAVRSAPASFASFSAAAGVRTPGEILAHIGDLLDWALSMAEGSQRWHNSESLPWDKEVERFFTALEKLDHYFSAGKAMHATADTLFQGPIADALTHVGQINILRRIAGAPIRGENYYVAEITAGRVGADQALPRQEFD
jgi:hypothetical protein